MVDDKTKTGMPDRDRINVTEVYELRDWSHKFGVSPERLKEAVAKVGPMASDVAKHLGTRLGPAARTRFSAMDLSKPAPPAGSWPRPNEGK